MKAFIVERYGKKGALRLADMPNPELRDDEALVEVHAAGVNLLDSKIRAHRGHDDEKHLVGAEVRVESIARQFKDNVLMERRAAIPVMLPTKRNATVHAADRESTTSYPSSARAKRD